MITLLTDFGVADYFVGAVKGVILSIHRQAQLIDLSHEVPRHDTEFAAFTLGACAKEFPAGTVHLVVVDPGVGSERRPIVVDAAQQFFIGPDNGVFSYIYRTDPRARVFHATQSEFFRSEPSSTFHGRDIFAPLAAHLDSGVEVERVGPEIDDYKKLPLAVARQVEPKEVFGSIIHIDRFGNCVTNLTEQHLSSGASGAQAFLTIGDVRITRVASTYSCSKDSSEPIAYLGSAGYWEIGIWCRSAAKELGIVRGSEVRLRL